VIFLRSRAKSFEYYFFDGRSPTRHLAGPLMEHFLEGIGLLR